MKILDELKQRGIFKDITNEDKFNNLSSESVYIGFDPTAKSLHLGNYVQMAILKRFGTAGFKPLAILGGATGMIGDPSGKSEERNLLEDKDIEENSNYIKKQLQSFGFEVLNNFDIYKNMSVIEYLRNIGKLLNINYMMAKDSVSSRMETGISYTEFSYQLIQGWDFKNYYDNNNVRIQVGGSDQWGNITSGIELIRKTNGDNNLAVGITTNLLTTSNGKKFGKSEGNALWLDKTMTTPFQMYQYLLSTIDDDVEKLLNWLTFIPLEEIKSIIIKHKEDTKKGFAQKELAFAVVKDIHGEAEANKSISITKILYGNADLTLISSEEALSLEGSIPTFKNILGGIIEVLVKINLAQSNREAREFLKSGGVLVNGNKVDETFVLEKSAYDGKANIIKRGKKKISLIKY